MRRTHLLDNEEEVDPDALHTFSPPLEEGGRWIPLHFLHQER